jgi:glycerol-3-phosphate dehydrogenase
MLKRKELLKQLEDNVIWDIIIIGGGATGLGAALESVSRGYKTLLVEQLDYTIGTSSRSTKLVHGGVRYLAQGDVDLVLEALKERGLLLKNAPHLVKNVSFLIPSYAWWYKPFLYFWINNLRFTRRAIKFWMVKTLFKERYYSKNAKFNQEKSTRKYFISRWTI